MATKLISSLTLCATLIVLTGCNSQAGPPDKTISGKEYNDIVNSTRPANEQGTPGKTKDAGTH